MASERRNAVIVMLIVTALLLAVFPVVSSARAPDNALFTMQTADGATSYTIVSSTEFTARIRVHNVGVLPIQVTVSTDSPYCSINTTDTKKIMPDRYDDVSFLFNFNRELRFDETIKLNFTGELSGDIVTGTKEVLHITLTSGKVLSAKVLDISFNGEQEENNIITFYTDVLNDGNVPVTVMAKLFKGKSEVDSNTLLIDVNQTQSIIISWVAEPGEHSFYVKVYLVTGYENNNPNGEPILLEMGQTGTVELDVTSASIIGGQGGNFVIYGILIVLLLIVVILVIKRKQVKAFFKKKRK